MKTAFKEIEVTSAPELRAWLAEHYIQSESIWLVTYKKSVPDKYLSTAEVLDELLCFGWIDGVRKKLDEDRTMQLISPRRVQHWTRSYKERAASLIKSGRMMDPGYDSIELSKQQGLWDFMDDVDQLIIPDDLIQALEQKKEASDFFHKINPSSKRFVLRWIKLSKTERTRKSRIKTIVDLAAKGEKLKGS